MPIATWNINSVRLRIHNVLRFIKEYDIDVICLQETKTENEYFPLSEFINAGIKNYYFRGEKSYNGIAILLIFVNNVIGEQFASKMQDSRYIQYTV